MLFIMWSPVSWELSKIYLWPHVVPNFGAPVMSCFQLCYSSQISSVSGKHVEHFEVFSKCILKCFWNKSSFQGIWYLKSIFLENQNYFSQLKLLTVLVNFIIIHEFYHHLSSLCHDIIISLLRKNSVLNLSIGYKVLLTILVNQVELINPQKILSEYA